MIGGEAAPIGGDEMSDQESLTMRHEEEIPRVPEIVYPPSRRDTSASCNYTGAKYVARRSAPWGWNVRVSRIVGCRG
jgi:hypothetical protein